MIETYKILSEKYDTNVIIYDFRAQLQGTGSRSEVFRFN